MEPKRTLEEVKTMTQELIDITGRAALLHERLSIWQPALPYMSYPMRKDGLPGIKAGDRVVKPGESVELWLTASGSFFELYIHENNRLEPVDLLYIARNYNVVACIDTVEDTMETTVKTRRVISREYIEPRIEPAPAQTIDPT